MPPSAFEEVINEALEANSISIEDVDHFLFHQANLRICEAGSEYGHTNVKSSH